MQKYGAIIAIGVVLLLFLILATQPQLGVPRHIVRGIIYLSVCGLFVLIAAAVSSASGWVALGAAVVAIVLLALALRAFGASDTSTPTGLLPVLNYLL